MKILLAGGAKEPAIELFFLRHLLELGADARILPTQDIFFEFYEKNIFNKLLFRAGLSSTYSKINEFFKREVEKSNPDVIWVFKGMELFPSTLNWAKERKIKLVNYNPDNPFFFTGKGSGNKNIIDAFRLYDLHFAYDQKVKDRIIQEYHIHSELLPFGFEENEALYQRCKAQEEKIELCFVGSPSKERADFLQRIATAVPLALYGPIWNKFVSHDNIVIHEAVHGETFWKALHRYRIQLNLLRPHNPNAHNMRSFEVPGIGGIMLAPDTLDHRQYFTENSEVFLYKSEEDCIAKIKLLLGMDKTAADLIRDRARQRSMDSGYSYFERTKWVLKNFEKLLCQN